MLQQIRNNYNVNSFCGDCMHLVVAKKVSAIRREKYSRMDIRKQSKIIKEKRKYCKKILRIETSNNTVKYRENSSVEIRENMLIKMANTRTIVLFYLTRIYSKNSVAKYAERLPSQF